MKTEVILDSGATVLVDITDMSDMSELLGNAAERNKGRRLVAVATPKLLANPATR